MPNQLASQVVALLNDQAIDFVTTPSAALEMTQDRPLQETRCDVTELNSPADLVISNAAGQETGLIGSGPDYQISVPGSSFYPFEDNQVAMTPSDAPYTITIQGTGTGTFDLVWRRWVDETVQVGRVFEDVPVSPQTRATLQVTTAGPVSDLLVDFDGDGSVDQAIGASAILDEVTGNDFDAPVTRAVVTGPAGGGQWYRGPVTVTLSGDDGQGSGVLQTQVVVGQGTAFSTYTGPITITAEGTHVLQALSTDRAGNSEAQPVTTTVRIDRSAPRSTVTVAGPRASDGWYTSAVTVTIAASDPALTNGEAGSGVARSDYSLDGGSTWQVYATPFRITTGGVVRLTTRSIDLAGNVETSSTQVLSVVPVAAVRPVLECVAVAPGGGYIARFGYSNDNRVPITIPAGSRNRFSPNPQDRGQTITFQPGRQVAVFEVPFVSGNQVWNLLGRTSTASPGSTRCP